MDVAGDVAGRMVSFRSFAQRGKRRNIPEQCQADVDEEICTTAGDDVDTNGWHWDWLAVIPLQKSMCVVRTEDGDEDQDKTRDGAHVCV